MKKVIFGLAAVTMITLAACSKDNCKVCSKEGASTVELCESNYNSNSAYGAAIDLLVNQGYECKDGKAVTVPN